MVAIPFICKNKSTFGKGAVTEATSVKPSIADDTVLIFHAKWCGHCKSSLVQFEKAVSGGNGKVVLIDEDNNKDLVKKYNIKGFPTIIKGDGTKFKGSRTPGDILKFATKK